MTVKPGRLAILLLAGLTVAFMAGYYWWQNHYLAKPETSLAIPVLPNLEPLDPPVRQQLRQRYEFLWYLMQDATADPQGLAWAFGQLGRVLHAYQFLDEARQCYQNAHTLAADEFLWAYYLGQVERVLRRFEQSSKYLQRALELRAGYLPTRIWLAENALEQGGLEQAESHFQQVLQDSPGHIMAYYGLARVALAQQQFPTAVRYLQRALAQQPQAYQLHYQLGLAYRGAGELALAQRAMAQVPSDWLLRVSIEFDDPLMQQVADLRLSSQSDARRGLKAMAQGNFKVAVRRLERAVQSNPQRTDTRFNLALSLLRLKRQDEAVEQLQAILERDPEAAKARALLQQLRQRADSPPNP